MKKGIKRIDGPGTGPTLAIFAGVHGNEKAGVYAIEKIKDTLKLKRGTVYLVLANQPAIASNTRMLEKNLNRCFFAENKGAADEDKRARELMKILDKCDALLDLHMFYDDNGAPFIICENNALEVAQIFDVPIISTNWTEVEPGGTDAYMYSQNKIGICIECGPLSKSRELTGFAENSINQFLQYYGLIEPVSAFSESSKKMVKALKAKYKTSEDFELLPGFSNFQPLKEGQLVAKDKSNEYRAKKDQVIIFPHYEARLNEEAYIIGELKDYPPQNGV